MIGTSTATLVFIQYVTDIQLVNYLIYNAYQMNRRNIFVQPAREKQNLVLAVRFKCYIYVGQHV